MKVEVIIKAFGQFDQTLPGSYTIGNKIRILTDEYNYSDHDLTPNKDKPYPVEFPLHFGQGTWAKKLSYNINDKGEPATNADMLKKRVIEGFYYMHPMCFLNGKRHGYTLNAEYGANGFFDIIDVHTQTLGELKVWDNKRKVANFLAESDLSVLRDIMYFYGMSPVGKSKGTICMELGGFAAGRVFSSADETEKFLDTWVRSIDSDKEYLVNCQKGINMNIIISAIQNGITSYYHGTQVIGNNLEDVVAFYKKNDNYYKDYLLRGIREKDHFEDELKLSATENNAFTYSLSEVDEKQLRDNVMKLYDEVVDIGKKDLIDFTKNSAKNAASAKLRTYFDKLNLILQAQPA